MSASEPDSPEIVFFRDHLASIRPQLAIFGGWHRVYEPLVDALHGQGVRVAVAWTSSPVQTALSLEAERFAALLEDARIGCWFFTANEFLPAVRRTGARAYYLPALVACLPEIAPKPPNDVPVVSLFLSPNEHRRKNVFACLLALAEIASPYVLWANGLSRRAEHAALLRRLDIPHQDFGWMTDDEYLLALDRVDIGLQVSLGESFDYVAAEHFSRGIPVVVSTMVPCAADLPEAVSRLLVVRNPDSPAEIARRVALLLERPDLRLEAGAVVREHIVALDERNVALAREALVVALSDVREH